MTVRERDLTSSMPAKLASDLYSYCRCLVWLTFQRRMFSTASRAVLRRRAALTSRCSARQVRPWRPQKLKWAQKPKPALPGIGRTVAATFRAWRLEAQLARRRFGAPAGVLIFWRNRFPETASSLMRDVFGNCKLRIVTNLKRLIRAFWPRIRACGTAPGSASVYLPGHRWSSRLPRRL